MTFFSADQKVILSMLRPQGPRCPAMYALRPKRVCRGRRLCAKHARCVQRRALCASMTARGATAPGVARPARRRAVCTFFWLIDCAGTTQNKWYQIYQKTPFLSSGGGRSFLFFLAFESSDIKKKRGGSEFFLAFESSDMNLKARGELVTSVGLQKDKAQAPPSAPHLSTVYVHMLSVWTVFQLYDKQARVQLAQSFDCERATQWREWTAFIL